MALSFWNMYMYIFFLGVCADRWDSIRFTIIILKKFSLSFSFFKNF